MYEEISYNKLTPRELKVLNILWNENRPLIASSITELGDLSISTTQVVTKSLLSKNLINIAEIVQNGKVFSRPFCPVINRKEFERLSVVDYCERKRMSTASLLG